MEPILRVPGNVPSRCWGSAYGDLVWAIGLSDDFTLSTREQAVRAFANLDKVLAGAGTDKTRIISATVMLADIDDKPMVDEIWVTDAPEDQVEERLTSLRGLDPEAGRARVRAQMPRADRLARAHAVIDNSSSLDELRPRVVDIWRSRVVRRLKKSRP